MTDNDIKNELFDALRRGAKRRDVLKYAGQATAVAGGLTLLSACGDDAFDHTIPPTPPYQTPSASPTPTPTPSPAPTGTPLIAAADIPYFQFLLNVEYLRTSFFLETSNYIKLTGTDVSGLGVANKAGTPGTVTLTPITAGPPADYSAAVVIYKSNDAASYAPIFATEMANVGVAMIRRLRTLLGSSAIAIPAIDLEGARTDSTGAWYTLANGAGVTAAGKAFNPSNLIASFLAGSNFLNSVALAAYRGVVPSLTPGGAAFLAGFIGTVSYYTALQRMVTNIQATADNTKAPLANLQKFSDFVDTLDGVLTDRDQGAGPGADTGTPNNAAVSLNVVASDTNGLALARSPAQTLNVLFLNKAAVSSGGFFPSGVNGTLTTSADTSTL